MQQAAQRPAAHARAGNFVDLVQQADYDKYFDTLGGAADGRRMAQYLEFSAKAARAASREGRAFLAMFPPADVRAARDALAL
jgi:hypothetical protein